MITREQYLEAVSIIQAYHLQLQQPLVMPSLHDFKARRELLGFSLREVAKETGVSPATISRIERGNEADYSNVKSLHEYYVSNEA
jgi:predicted transcriptional regulator